MRVLNSTDASGSVAPVVPFDLIAEVGQFNSAAGGGATTGYQLSPRRRADIIEAATPMQLLPGSPGVTASGCGATVGVELNQNGDATLQYGPTAAYGTTVPDAAQSTLHNFTINGLAASTLYHARMNGSGASGVYDTGDFTFTTPVVSVPAAGNALRGTKAVGGSACLPSPVVISQVYGGGGNSGAQYQNDYIELLNRGDAPVDLTGWSVQYNSFSSTTTPWLVTALSGSIPPGHYFFVKESSGGANGVPPPTADVTGTLAMSNTHGKVALLNTTAALAVQCPVGQANLMDFVGYGTDVNCHEGASLIPLLSNTTAGLRKGSGGTGTAGCQDGDNNGADFTVAAPAPRNSASAASGCSNCSAAPGGVRLDWAVAAVDNYHLYGLTAANGAPALLATLPAGTATYTDSASPSAFYDMRNYNVCGGESGP
jgi:hypothetical protein